MATWRAFSRLIAGSRRLAAWSLCLSVATSVVLVPIALLVRTAFNDSIPSHDTNQLLLIGAVVLVLYLLSLAFALGGRYSVMRVTKPAVASVRAELIEKIVWLPSSVYDETDSARLHSLIVQDTDRLDLMARLLLAAVIPSLGTAAILIAVLAVIQPLLLIILLVAIPLLIVLRRSLRAVLERRARLFQEDSDSFSAGVLTTLRSATLIKLQTAEEEEIAARTAEADTVGLAGLRLTWLQQAYGLGQLGISGVAGVIVLIGGGIAVADGKMSIGDLIAFMSVLALARGQLNFVAAALPDVLTGLAAIERIDEVLAQTEREPYAGSRRISFGGSIAWDHVSFGYVEGEAPVLNDVSLEISAGETIAVLGPTGAGKTTLMALALGLYRPWAGRILIDGEPLEGIDVRDLRRQAGVLLSEGVVMRGTVHENIAFGAAGVSRKEVRRAAELATAGEFIAGLAEGFDTEIGDDGIRLSAGQRQRIALARALLGGPPLLILDEPTSHLDGATAARLLDNLAGLSGDPTLLLVTHDPLVARHADRQVEVRDGRCTEAVTANGAQGSMPAGAPTAGSGREAEQPAELN